MLTSWRVRLSKVCSAMASQILFVASEMSPDSVFRQEIISSNRRCRANTGRYRNTFAGVLCPFQSLCCQNMLTDNADVPDFSTLFNTLKLQAGHEVVLLLRSLEC